MVVVQLNEPLVFNFLLEGRINFLNKMKDNRINNLHTQSV